MKDNTINNFKEFDLNIISLIEEKCEIDNLKQYLEENDDLSSFGINSVKFIMLVLELENYFDIEFEDEDLSYKNFNSYNELRNYVSNKVKNNE